MMKRSAIAAAAVLLAVTLTNCAATAPENAGNATAAARTPTVEVEAVTPSPSPEAADPGYTEMEELFLSDVRLFEPEKDDTALLDAGYEYCAMDRGYELIDGVDPGFAFAADQSICLDD